MSENQSQATIKLFYPVRCESQPAYQLSYRGLNYTVNPNHKYAFSLPQKLTVKIALILLYFSSSLFFCKISWAQSITRTEVTRHQTQLLPSAHFSFEELNDTFSCRGRATFILK